MNHIDQIIILVFVMGATIGFVLGFFINTYLDK